MAVKTSYCLSRDEIQRMMMCVYLSVKQVVKTLVQIVKNMVDGVIQP